MRVIIFDSNIYFEKSRIFTVMDLIYYIRDTVTNLDGYGVWVWEDINIRRSDFLNRGESIDAIRTVFNYLVEFFDTVGFPQIKIDNRRIVEVIRGILEGEFWTSQISDFVIVSQNRGMFELVTKDVYLLYQNKIFDEKAVLDETGFTPQELRENGSVDFLPEEKQHIIEGLYFSCIDNQKIKQYESRQMKKELLEFFKDYFNKYLVFRNGIKLLFKS